MKEKDQSEMIRGFFEKGGFLYDIYCEVKLLPKNVEAEVTQYAVEKYKAYYQCYQGLEIGNENAQTESRRQMSSLGCYLTKNNQTIDIAADILTSMKTPITNCMKNVFAYGFSEDESKRAKEKGSIYIADKKVFQKLKAKETLFQSMNAFIKVNHTIGNMMPIPEGLNTTWKTCLTGEEVRADLPYKDNVDYKIRCLREYFRIKDKENLKERYANEADQIERLIKKAPPLPFFAYGKSRRDEKGEIGPTTGNGVCAVWLTDYFDSCTWPCFVEQNFLQDFFEDEKYEKIIDKAAYPKDGNVSNWTAWFDRMTECIIRRGYRMTEGKEIDSDLLEDIRGEIKRLILE